MLNQMGRKTLSINRWKFKFLYIFAIYKLLIKFFSHFFQNESYKFKSLSSDIEIKSGASSECM